MRDRYSLVDLDNLLDSRIEVRLLKINKRVTIPQQICFRLDAKTIEAIEQANVSQGQFKLSQANLATLRCYALFNLSSKSKQSKNHQSYLSQSSLIFSTQYLESGFNSDLLVRSTIDSKGKILQQIKQELIQNPLLLERVLNAHYWLTYEILTQLPLKPKNSRSWLIYSCLTVANLAAYGLIWYLLPQSSFIKLIICLFLFGIGLIAIAISKQLKSWIIHQIVAKAFSQGTIKRKLSLKLLNFLI